MWDYDKLFAEGNIVGMKLTNDCIHPMVIDNKGVSNDFKKNYENDNLYCCGYQIQYIIRLDEHGNVVEKLFDRKRDMVKPMPELEDGMFVRVEDEGLGYVDIRNNRIVYQHGGYDVLDGDEYLPNVRLKIIEVYSENACAFSYCNNDVLIWRDPDYQAYLDSKYK